MYRLRWVHCSSDDPPQANGQQPPPARLPGAGSGGRRRAVSGQVEPLLLQGHRRSLFPLPWSAHRLRDTHSANPHSGWPGTARRGGPVHHSASDKRPFARDGRVDLPQAGAREPGAVGGADRATHGPRGAGIRPLLAALLASSGTHELKILLTLSGPPRWLRPHRRVSARAPSAARRASIRTQPNCVLMEFSGGRACGMAIRSVATSRVRRFLRRLR